MNYVSEDRFDAIIDKWMELNKVNDELFENLLNRIERLESLLEKNT